MYLFELVFFFVCFFVFGFCFLFFPSSGISGSYGDSIFSFLGSSILFSTVAVPIYISTNSVGGFTFLHMLANICCLYFFNLFIYLSIYFWLLWVFIAACRLSLVAVRGLLIAVAFLVAEHGL